MTTPWQLAATVAGRALLPLLLALGLGARSAPAQDAEPLLHGQGLLWRIELPAVAPSYLFGSMHSSDQRVVELPQPVAEALAASRSLSLEIVATPQTQQRIGQAMRFADDRRLDQVIGPELLAQVLRVGERYGFAPEQVMRLKPWALMTIFSVPPSELQHSEQGALPLDQVLQARALDRGMPVYGLETVDEQLAIFEEMPLRDQTTFLGLAVEKHDQVDRWFEEMKRHYLERDLSAVKHLVERQAAGSDPALLAALEERLIVRRNRHLAERMVERLHEGAAFVAVGALHLPGEDGVLALLAEEGYRISRVY